LLLLCGCPKKDLPDIEEVERREQLKELLGEEIFEDLPEAGEEDEPENFTSSN
jgi:hypothetical protein